MTMNSLQDKQEKRRQKEIKENFQTPLRVRMLQSRYP